MYDALTVTNALDESMLEFHGARLCVRLGWLDAERAEAQAVDLAVRIRFAQTPRACDSDALDDTVCYATLVERARALCVDRSFRLLEHLAWSLGRQLRELVPSDARMELCVTKLHPPVAELSGGVSFRLTLSGTRPAQPR